MFSIFLTANELNHWIDHCTPESFDDEGEDEGEGEDQQRRHLRQRKRVGDHSDLECISQVSKSKWTINAGWSPWTKHQIMNWLTLSTSYNQLKSWSCVKYHCKQPSRLITPQRPIQEKDRDFEYSYHWYMILLKTMSTYYLNYSNIFFILLGTFLKISPNLTW